MKKKTAIFLTALLLLCMVIPAFAEQAVTFPQGTITSEPIELFSEHFHVSIDAGVYVPGDLMERWEGIYRAMETVSGIRFEDGAYARKIEVRCRANETSEEGEFYVPVAYQNQIDLYPADLLANGSDAILHEMSHTLNYFYHEASEDWESRLMAEGFAEYTSYQTAKWLEENDPALAYAVGPSQQILYNVALEDEETLYTEELSHWMKEPYPYSGNPGYSEGLRFMAYLERVYGNDTAWMTALDQTAKGKRVEREVSALKASYGEDVLDGFYPWLKENSALFDYGDMDAPVDLRGVQQVTLYPTFNRLENVARLSGRSVRYSDLYVDLSQAMLYLRDYKGKDVSAAQLKVDCLTTVDVFDANGNLLTTIDKEGVIPMDGVAYVRLNGIGTLYGLDLIGWGEFYW